MTLAEIIEQLQALQSSQPQFSQAQLDEAVLAAVTPLNAAVESLQAQVAAMPEAIHQAVLAEDAMVAQKIKPIIDELIAAVVL